MINEDYRDYLQTLLKRHGIKYQSSAEYFNAKHSVRKVDLKEYGKSIPLCDLTEEDTP